MTLWTPCGHCQRRSPSADRAAHVGTPKIAARTERFDAFGDPEMAIFRQSGEPNRTAGDGIEHLLARRRLGRAVIEQERAMDAACRHARAVAHDGDHARPAAFGVVVGQVRMEQQVRRSRIPEPPALQVALGNGAGERLAAVEDAGDLVGMVDATDEPALAGQARRPCARAELPPRTARCRPGRSRDESGR